MGGTQVHNPENKEENRNKCPTCGAVKPIVVREG